MENFTLWNISKHEIVYSKLYMPFGTTYKCKQAFFSGELIKNKNKTKMMDENLNSSMILETTNFNTKY